MVKIRKIRTTFQVRFDYQTELAAYCKTIPKDQVKIQVNTLDGGKEDWYRACNLAGVYKILWFCFYKNIAYEFENCTKQEEDNIIECAREKMNRYVNAKKIKNKEIDVDKEDYSFMKIQPYKYQKEAIAFFEGVNGVALLGDQPGVGKSLAAAAYGAKHHLKTLIVCPASMKTVWYRTIKNFTNAKPFIFKYVQKKKIKDDIEVYDPEECQFHIINYESLEGYIKFEFHHKCQTYHCDFEETNTTRKYKGCPKCQRLKTVKSKNTKKFIPITDPKGVSLDVNKYDMIVLDEAHYIKDETTIRSSIIKNSLHVIPKKILLTGTAIKSRPYEFYALLNFLDPQEWTNSHAFGIRYCDGKQDKFGHWNFDGHSNLEEFYKRISYLYLRRLKSDPGVLEHLPPKTYTIIPIELSPEEMREYNKLEKGVVEESEEGDNKMTFLERVQKLKQFTSKICAERAKEFIQTIIDGEEKVVVFSQYVDTVETIYNHFKNQSVKYTGSMNIHQKKDSEDKFMNDSNCYIFAGTIGAAGVGLTLTSASTLIFIDQPWTPSDRSQAEDRIHRANMASDKAHIIRLICQGTIDEDIEKLLNDKEVITTQVLDGKIMNKKVNYSIFDDLVKIILDKKDSRI